MVFKLHILNLFYVFIFFKTYCLENHELLSFLLILKNNCAIEISHSIILEKVHFQFDFIPVFCSHNPKINTFTSVYQTPLNVNRRKSPGDLHGVSYLLLNFKTAFKESFLAQTPIQFSSMCLNVNLPIFFTYTRM